MAEQASLVFLKTPVKPILGPQSAQLAVHESGSNAELRIVTRHRAHTQRADQAAAQPANLAASGFASHDRVAASRQPAQQHAQLAVVEMVEKQIGYHQIEARHSAFQ